MHPAQRHLHALGFLVLVALFAGPTRSQEPPVAGWRLRRASLSCDELVRRGVCFSRPAQMLSGPCADACARFRGLPREAVNWASPMSCFSRGAPGLVRSGSLLPALDPEGYFQLSHGREQMNKHKWLVLDGLHYAAALNRTFVEPAVSMSRLVTPPATFTKGSTLGFGSYWSMLPLCQRHRVISLEQFTRMRDEHRLKAALVRPLSLAEGRIAGLRLQTAAAARAKFAPLKQARVIQFAGFYRSNVRWPEGAQLRLTPALRPFAARLAKQLLSANFAVVQWRAETIPKELWSPCTQAVIAAISAICARHKLRPRDVLLLSDLWANTSGTFNRARAQRAAAIAMIEERLPGVTRNPMHTVLGMISDSGIKAITEQFLAIRAPLFFAASIGLRSHGHGSFRDRCAKLGSGFVATIIAERTRGGLKSLPLLALPEPRPDER